MWKIAIAIAIVSACGVEPESLRVDSELVDYVSCEEVNCVDPDITGPGVCIWECTDAYGDPARATVHRNWSNDGCLIATVTLEACR